MSHQHLPPRVTRTPGRCGTVRHIWVSQPANQIEAAEWADPYLKLTNDAALQNHYRCGHGVSSRSGTNGAIQCEWRHTAKRFCCPGGNRSSEYVHPVRDNGSECQERGRDSGLPSVFCARVPGGVRRKHHSARSKIRDGLGASARRRVESRLGCTTIHLTIAASPSSVRFVLHRRG